MVPLSLAWRTCWSSLLGSSRMSAWIPDTLREVRLWSSHSDSNCPWFLLVTLGVCIGCFCWCAGLFAGALIFSAQCRRCLGQSIRILVATWYPVAPLDLRGRLAEYRRDCWCPPKLLWKTILKLSLFYLLGSGSLFLLDLLRPILRDQFQVTRLWVPLPLKRVHLISLLWPHLLQ